MQGVKINFFFNRYPFHKVTEPIKKKPFVSNTRNLYSSKYKNLKSYLQYLCCSSNVNTFFSGKTFLLIWSLFTLRSFQIKFFKFILQVIISAVIVFIQHLLSITKILEEGTTCGKNYFQKHVLMYNKIVKIKFECFSVMKIPALY